MLLTKNWSPMKRLIFMRGSGISGGATYDTITGNPVQFTALASPLKSLSASFSPVQASGTPSPDNPLPISGWGGAEVWRTGKNLFDKSMTFSVGYYSPSTGAYSPDSNAKTTDYIPVKAGQTITANKYQVSMSGSTYTFFASWTYWDENKQFISGKWNPSAQDTVPAGAAYLRMGTTRDYTDVWDSFIDDYMLVFGATASSYVPYNGTSISLSFGSTLYSGTIDVLTGVVTVTHGKLVLDGTQSGLVKNWRSSATSAGFYYNLTGLDVLAPAGLDFKTTSISDKLKSASYQDCYYGREGYDASFSWFNTSGWNRLVGRIPDPTLTTKELLTAYFTNNPITIVYPIATPIPISLTPQEVESLAGDNVMWSNANQPITVTYRQN